MIQAKLFVLGQERELLWISIDYQRGTRLNGKPNTEVLGGLITLCYKAKENDDIILRWMSKPSEDDTWEEVDKMEKGKICFYENGFDHPPTKTHEFNDGLLVHYEEIFCANGAEPMKTIIVISPAIQNYGTDFIKRWNVSWIPPEERPYQPVENNEQRITALYYTDKDNKTDTKLTYGEKAYLVLESRNMIGEIVDLKLSEKNIDFTYNDKRLKNNTIEGYKIKSDTDKIPVYVISEDNDELE